MNNFIENIISGIIGGVVVYLIQIFKENRKEKKIKFENDKVGKRDSKFIDENFLYNYQPGSLSIEKVIQDFGQPIEKYEYPVDFENNINVTIYKYKFVNAVILFSTSKNESSVISITLNSSSSKLHPVILPYTFDESDKYFGDARITREIIENERRFEKESYTNWMYAAIQSKYFNREIKYLTFTYVVCSTDVESIADMENKIIDQLCISANMDIYPIINFMKCYSCTQSSRRLRQTFHHQIWRFLNSHLNCPFHQLDIPVLLTPLK